MIGDTAAEVLAVENLVMGRNNVFLIAHDVVDDIIGGYTVGIIAVNGAGIIEAEVIVEIVEGLDKLTVACAPRSGIKVAGDEDRKLSEAAVL